MLRITPEQMEAFGAAAFRRFVDRLVEHARLVFMAHCDALGREGVRPFVEQQVERARGCGVVGERSVCRYVDLTFAFGPDFRDDPDLTWSQDGPDVDGMCAAAMEYLEELAADGEDDVPEIVGAGGPSVPADRLRQMLEAAFANGDLTFSERPVDSPVEPMTPPTG